MNQGDLIQLEKNDVDNKLGEIGTRVRNIRKKKGFSQEQLAKKALVSVATIGRLESGKCVSSRTLLGISKVIGVNLVRPFHK